MMCSRLHGLCKRFLGKQDRTCSEYTICTKHSQQARAHHWYLACHSVFNSAERKYQVMFLYFFLQMAVNLGEEGFASCGSDGLVVLWKVSFLVLVLIRFLFYECLVSFFC